VVYMENVKSFFSENKISTYNKFTKFLLENNITKLVNLFWQIIRENKFWRLKLVKAWWEVPDFFFFVVYFYFPRKMSSHFPYSTAMLLMYVLPHLQFFPESAIKTEFFETSEPNAGP
jgi:hypothetical protein